MQRYLVSNMFVYQLTVDGSEVTISLKSNHPDKSADIEIKGDAEPVAKVRTWLRSQCGMFGHTIDIRRTAPIDLSAAMHGKSAKQFKPKLLEGADIVKNYESPIPEGSLS